jgi:hypothetical protein
MYALSFLTSFRICTVVCAHRCARPKQSLLELGRTIWIVDAHRGDGKRFVVHADEKLTAFLELEAAIRQRGFFALTKPRRFFKT